MASMSICYLTVSPKSHFLTVTHKPLKPSQFHYFAPLKSSVIPRGRKLRCGKASVSFITASSRSGSGSGNTDVVTTSAIRPGGRVESDKFPKDVRERPMAAIDSSGRRVTIGDVAIKAGLKLSESQKALQALAADTNGFLEVLDERDVLYVFPKNYQSNLVAKSFRIKFEPLLEKGKECVGGVSG